MGERFVLLGVAPVRADWFRRVAGWAASAALPAEFVRCVSVTELAARLAGDRPFSAALIDTATSGLDGDVIRGAVEAGCAVVIVDGSEARRDWHQLGAAAVLPPDLSREQLLEVLRTRATQVPAASFRLPDPPPPTAGPRAPLIAVTGPGGTGVSVLTIALAQGLASVTGRLPWDDRPPTEHHPSVVLADLCRVADQALLHDARHLIPGVQELIEAHRTARPELAAVRAQTFEVPARGYRLLLGLRRPRHWVGLRRQALHAVLDALQQLADVVVADVEADVEGEAETGSLDVEDRNLFARTTLTRADLALVVGGPSLAGTAALVRVLTDLVDLGIAPERLLPVVNRSPRSPRRRAEVTGAVVELAAASTGRPGERFLPPLHVPERDPDPALRDGVALPGPIPRILAQTVAAVLGRTVAAVPPTTAEPDPVVPGSLATFTSQEPPSP